MILLTLLAAGGCAEISGNHAEVVTARLFRDDGTELTPVVPVPDGDVIVVEARFYDASGNEMDLQYPEHATEMWAIPSQLLYVAPVPDEPFRRELTLRTPCPQEPPSLTIGYGHWGRGDEREFGPFEVQPVGEVGSFEVFGPNDEQLTPEVRLPFQETIRIEVRLFACDGQQITVPANRSILIYWSDPELVDAEPVAGERFVFDVTALQPVGTTGQMSIGWGTDQRPALRVIGPFSLEIVEAAAPEPEV